MLVSLPWDLSRYEPLSLQPYLCSGGVEDASALAHFLSVDNLISFLLNCRKLLSTPFETLFVADASWKLGHGGGIDELSTQLCRPRPGDDG